MAWLRLAWAFALVLLSAASAAAADQRRPAFLFDNLAPARAAVKAKTTDYGYDSYAEPHLACLKQTSIKNCRYTGCPVHNQFDDCTTTSGDCTTCQPDSLYFQTDFNCCSREQSYSYGAHSRLNDLGFDSKIGTCDWEISLYRCGGEIGANGGISDPWCPHYTEDGSALKWGTAWGTCYLNNHAEHCDQPLCERMVISIQGGLYASCAYSTESSGFELWGPARTPGSNFCREEREIGWPEPNARRVAAEIMEELRQVRQGKPTTPAPAAPKPASSAKQAKDARQPPAEIGLADEFDGYFTYIWANSAAYLAESCGAGSLSGSRLANPGGAKKQAEAQLMNEYHHDETYYKGMALIVSGPMYITSKKDQKVEETGMFEMTLAYTSGDTSGTTSDPTNHWPVVNGYSSKVRFNKEKDNYYYGNEGGRE